MVLRPRNADQHFKQRRSVEWSEQTPVDLLARIILSEPCGFKSGALTAPNKNPRKIAEYQRMVRKPGLRACRRVGQADRSARCACASFASLSEPCGFKSGALTAPNKNPRKIAEYQRMVRKPGLRACRRVGQADRSARCACASFASLSEPCGFKSGALTTPNKNPRKIAGVFIW